ncbi:MAG: methyltransferase domain-containing protein [Pseudomonadota bacterium]
MSEIDLDALAAAYEAGLAAEKAGDSDAAVAAYRRCLDLDHEDRGGVSVRLAALGAAPAPERAPPAYVATLFDQHAEAFEMTLVHSLGYAIPDEIAEALRADGLMPASGRFAAALDLGCGTGLVGEALEGMVDAMDGVDLSEDMVALADEKELYRDLFVGDAEAFCLQSPPDAYALVVAADVLPYLGTVSPLFRAVARVTSAGGIFAFSTERLAEEASAGRGFAVGPGRRFAHTLDALQGALAAVGYVPTAVYETVVRHEKGRPVDGHLVLATLGSSAGRQTGPRR